MIRAALLVALASAVFLGAAPTARAWTAPGQRAADPAVRDIVEPALAFWRARGLTNCPDGPTVWQAPKLDVGGADAAWGLGDGATCEIWISDSLAHIIDDPVTSFGYTVDACTAVTHEVGHALGLPHSSSGVMANVRPPRRHEWAPSFCWGWARTTLAEVLRGYGYHERTIQRWLRAYERRTHNGAA